MGGRRRPPGPRPLGVCASSAATPARRSVERRRRGIDKVEERVKRRGGDKVEERRREELKGEEEISCRPLRSPRRSFSRLVLPTGTINRSLVPVGNTNRE
jgi:hypothetical protein